MKYKPYAGQTLYDVLVTYKIDGVQARKVDGEVVSRKGKPLYNINMTYDVAEIYAGSWEESVSLVRTQSYKYIPDEFVYSLNPVDSRLIYGTFAVMEDKDVQAIFQSAVQQGYEGLVLHTKDCLYKVKGKETYDVKVTGVVEGTGKHKGRLGAVMTEMGKVGTGFTDVNRNDFWPNIVGETIEVECMSLTPSGKFRHPRFLRLRFDK